MIRGSVAFEGRLSFLFIRVNCRVLGNCSMARDGFRIGGVVGEGGNVYFEYDACV